MITYRRTLLIIPLLLITSLLPTIALTNGAAASGRAGCPSGTVCDTALGIALTPARTWLRLPHGAYPPHTVGFATRPAGAVGYNVRLLIEPYALTSIRNDGRAAQLTATKLMRAEGATSVTQLSIRYGGSPGILLRDLPGSLTPSLDIIVAHQKAVYLIIAPGASLAADQRHALATLSFIPRTGHFLPPVGG